MARALEMPRDPLAFRTRLEENARRSAIAKHRREALATRHDALVGHGSVRSQDAELTLAFVQIHPYRVPMRLACVWVRL